MSFNLASCDIECTDLDARWARLLTCAFKPMGRKAYCLVNPQLTRPRGKRGSDHQMLVQIRDEMEKYDMLIWYYGAGKRRFDLPMLNSRLITYGSRIIAPRLHIDMYPIVRDNLRLKRNRLMDVADLLHIEGKTHIQPDDWVEAAWDGQKKAVRNIVEHNLGDVEVLEEVFLRLKGYVRVVRRF